MTYVAPLWYIVEHPFTRPIVKGGYRYKEDAIKDVRDQLGKFTRRVVMYDNEIWIGGQVICTIDRLKANNWHKHLVKTKTKPNPRMPRKTRWERIG